MKHWLMLLAVPVLAHAGAMDECLQASGAMPEVSHCLMHRLAVAEKKLAEAEAASLLRMQALDRLTPRRFHAAAALQQAQQAFGQYRDKQCRWQQAAYASGNGSGQARLACEIDLIEQRLIQLSQ